MYSTLCISSLLSTDLCPRHFLHVFVLQPFFCASGALRKVGWSASYTASFKLKVVDHVLKHENCRARQHFSVDPTRVRYWRKQEEELRAVNRDRCALCGPKEEKFPGAKKGLLDYTLK